MGDGSTVIKVPSRVLPAGAIFLAVGSILSSVACCFAYGHDFGGTYWPYISDTAKSMPQAGFFSFAMSLTSLMIMLVVYIHHGKVKLNLYSLTEEREEAVEGLRRSKLARAAGCFAGPNLGFLACYDTARAPELHMIFVLLFFVPCLVYFVCTISLYNLMVRKLAARRASGKKKIERLSYISLETSLRWKRRVGYAFAFFFTLYLPIGMCLVSDWYDYRNDVYVHSFRAVMQHCTVICIVLFFGTMWYDFGDLTFHLAQF